MFFFLSDRAYSENWSLSMDFGIIYHVTGDERLLTISTKFPCPINEVWKKSSGFPWEKDDVFLLNSPLLVYFRGEFREGTLQGVVYRKGAPNTLSLKRFLLDDYHVEMSERFIGVRRFSRDVPFRGQCAGNVNLYKFPIMVGPLFLRATKPALIPQPVLKTPEKIPKIFRARWGPYWGDDEVEPTADSGMASSDLPLKKRPPPAESGSPIFLSGIADIIHGASNFPSLIRIGPGSSIQVSRSPSATPPTPPPTTPEEPTSTMRLRKRAGRGSSS